ncbi:MAG: hypothetical protein EAZ55_07890 [Cytophagales bacterium]|nr:MAG: hypothetical protein EAZ55_07890 [Cytophagales bacterium]
MQIEKPFSQYTYTKLIYLLEHKEQYKNFNTLGFFRGILENKKMTLEEKIQLRDKAITVFSKFYEFLQVKDPHTYLKLETLGQELSWGNLRNLWKEIYKKQSLILKQKRIKHRNFGTYSKHNCGYADCHLNQLMLKQNSWFKEDILTLKEETKHFRSKNSRKYKEKKIESKYNLDNWSES